MERRGCIQDICGKPGRKKLLGRPRRRWVDNIKFDLRGAGWGGIDWIGLIWHREGTSVELLRTVMKLRVP
jgi:hypothetical protein